MRKFAMALTLASGGFFLASSPAAAKSPLCAQLTLPGKDAYLECSPLWERFYVEGAPCLRALRIRCRLPAEEASSATLVFFFGGVKNGSKGGIFILTRSEPPRAVFAALEKAGFAAAALPLHDGRGRQEDLEATTFNLKHLASRGSPFSIDLRRAAIRQLREGSALWRGLRREAAEERRGFRLCAPAEPAIRVLLHPDRAPSEDCSP